MVFFKIRQLKGTANCTEQKTLESLVKLMSKNSNISDKEHCNK